MKIKPTHLIIGLALLISAPSVLAQRGPKVAIIPVANTSGEKWNDLKASETDRGNEFLRDEFGKRGFEVIPAASINSILSDQKLDMADEEQWKRDTLYSVGEKAGADYVIFAAITDNGQHKSPNFFTTTAEGWANVKVWLLDVKKKTAILSAKTFKGSSKHSEILFGTVKGSSLQTLAVANGLRDALKEFFSSYPVVRQEGGH